MIGPVVVGDVTLPDLPPGTPVSFDTECSGLYVDADPGTDSGDPGSPPARVSAASIAFRDPETGNLVKYAWGFDQGPHPSKPGRVRRPREGGGVEPLDCDKLLMSLAKAGFNKGEEVVLGKSGKPLKKLRPIPYLWEECYEAIGLHHWVNLLKWLRDRDLLILWNAKFDLHIAAAGPRDWLCRQQWKTNLALRAVLGARAADFIEPASWTDEDLGWMMGLNLDYLADGTLRPVRGFWDGMIAQALFEPLESVALKKTGKRVLRADADARQKDLMAAMSKQGVGLTKRYDLTPWFIMKDYAADDAELTLLVYEYEQACIEVGDCPEFLDYHLDKEFELMRTLYRMERRGVGYDVTSSRRGAQILTDRMSTIEKDLPYDPGKLSQVKTFYFGEPPEGLGLIPLKLTEETGAPSLDESQVRVWVESKTPPPFVQEYDEWSHCRSAVGKWYRGWAERTGPDGRIRTVFKQCVIEEERAGARGGGAITGRLAVGRFQGQAIPHNGQLPEQVQHIPVRRLIRAAPGYALYEMDLPQGEVRIATAIANCQGMWEAIEQDRDLHGENAKRIWSIDEQDPRYYDLRGVGKRITFGTLYGAGIKTLRDQILQYTGVDYSLAETRAAKDAFDQAFPEFRRASRLAQNLADRNLGGRGWLRMLDGRRRWFGPDEFTHKAFNAVIQGNLAQTGKTWMNRVERELPGILLLQIHDSLLVEVEDSAEGRALAQQAADIGTEIHEHDYSLHGRKMPFKIDIKEWVEAA